MAQAGAEIVIDLGTAFTRICRTGSPGPVVEEPSVVRVRPGVGLVEAVGRRALEPGLPGVLRPVLDAGVVTDLDTAAMLLQKLLWPLRGSAMVRPSLLLCAPSDARPPELARLTEAGRRAGASVVYVAPEPLAAAIGAGLDFGTGAARLVLDIGEGVTDLGLLRRGRLEASWAVRAGCSSLRRSVARALAETCALELAADTIDALIGAALAPGDGELRVSGRDRASGEPVARPADRRHLASAVEPAVTQILRTLQRAQAYLGPAGWSQALESEAILVGGGSLLPDLRERLGRESGLGFRVPDDPLRAVVRGARLLANGAGRRPH